MKFNELITAEASALDNEQKDFINLHKLIIANGNASYAYAIEMARGLKEMRDGGKYKTAGFATFSEYTESACGIKERHAYNYISVVENLSSEFLQSNAKFGISKLVMLAAMDSEDRNDLLAAHGTELEDMTTREMDKLRKDYENRIQQMQFEFDEQLKEKNDEIELLEEEADTIDLSSYLQRVEDEKAALVAEIETLKNTAPKVDNKTVAELEKANAALAKLKAEKEVVEKNLTAAKEMAEKEITAVLEKERAAVKVIEKDLELERARVREEAKKAQIAVDPIMSEFKANFKIWQEMGNGLVRLVGEAEKESAEICKKALSAAIGAMGGKI